MAKKYFYGEVSTLYKLSEPLENLPDFTNSSASPGQREYVVGEFEAEIPTVTSELLSYFTPYYAVNDGLREHPFYFYRMPAAGVRLPFELNGTLMCADSVVSVNDSEEYVGASPYGSGGTDDTLRPNSTVNSPNSYAVIGKENDRKIIHEYNCRFQRSAAASPCRQIALFRALFEDTSTIKGIKNTYVKDSNNRDCVKAFGPTYHGLDVATFINKNIENICTSEPSVSFSASGYNYLYRTGDTTSSILSDGTSLIYPNEKFHWPSFYGPSYGNIFINCPDGLGSAFEYKSAYMYLIDELGKWWVMYLTGQVQYTGTSTAANLAPNRSINNAGICLCRVQDLPVRISSTVTTGTGQINAEFEFTQNPDARNDALTALFRDDPDDQGDIIIPDGSIGDLPRQNPTDPYYRNTDGTRDWTSDTIPISTPTEIGLANSTLFQVYRADKAYQSMLVFTEYLGGALWSNTLIDAISNTNSDIKNCIISFGTIPVEVPYSTEKYPIRMGGKTFDISETPGVPIYLEAPRVVQQYITKDMGTLTVNKFHGTYMDYAPYTKIQIFLPYLGYQTLNTNEVMGKTLNLQYTFDVFTGLFVAKIFIDGNEINSFNGNALNTYPLSGADFSSKLTGLVQTVGGFTTFAAGASTDNAALMLMGLGSITNGVNSIDKQNVYRNGNFSSAWGTMACKTPFLIIDSPNVAYPTNGDIIRGRISHYSAYVSNCFGFTQFEELHLDKVNCSDEEKDMITAMFKEGVIIE